MPRRKASEVQEEMDQPVIQKHDTFATRWFKDNAVNNPDDLRIICDATAKSCEDQFYLYLKSNHTETYAIIFFSTFNTILAFLREKQKQYKNFTMEIANSVNIGYCNNNDENNEKTGNFFPVMEYIGINRNVVDNNFADITETSSAENYIKWKELNCKKNAEMLKTIQENAYQDLKQNYHVSLRQSEAVIPIFCIFLDMCMNLCKQKYRELVDTNISETSINVLNLFDIYYSYDENTGTDVIEFQPSVYMKLQLKNDNQAEV